MRWANVVAVLLLPLGFSQQLALGSWYEQDGPAPPAARSDVVPAQTPPVPAQQPATRPGQQPPATRPGQQPPATRPGQQPPTAPRATQPRPPATAPPTAAPTAPLAQPPATTTPLPPGLRAELERSLTSDLDESPFAGQPGTFGTLAALPSGGNPQMIGDLGPLPRTSSLPQPFPPPKPPGVPGTEGPPW